MPVTLASVRNVPYLVNNRNVAFVAAPLVGAPPAGASVRFRQEHIRYALGDCRMNHAVNPPTVLDNRASITLTPNALGDTIYLHYEWNHISSVRLPSPAPAGVTLFVTDNMSGCRFFVDQVTGTNDFVVYHANTTQHSAGALADCDVQTAQATQVLDDMLTNARLDYGIGLAGVGDLPKPTYFGVGGRRERHYIAQGYTGTDPTVPRQAPSFAGGTTVLGFPTAGGSWEFWYQTWGMWDRQIPAWVEQRPWYQRNVRHAANDVHTAANAGPEIFVRDYAQI